MTTNIMLAGVGGQGTVLASKLIAQSAMNHGQNARTAETIGMAQRGGCVVSHVRIGEELHSPMIPQGSADLLIGFEPAEAVRCLPYLREGGTVVVSSKAIKPVTASLSGSDYNGAEMLAFLKQQVEKLIVVDGEGICAQCGSAKVLNVALLGAAAASGVLGLTLEQLLETIRQRIPERFLDSNLKALSAGAKAATGE
ncbi:putative indolepyruvate ferredoxin oxidoreductase, beta subunit [[Clostridium] methylpentosum DSM 5476]|jgi:indolepyruvate ferredoxin oxidoreductase, beta subunit|uniref:Putative indolepyruvate ferredoxin oxidoreductase, beta subunit n=1 Tax=[Clostridium] methylpentosum DSM 5476 TaxID=537013 RepID=C0EI19_9FIRM|nr:putative indolepyruvate ferredoxin oxidoreductase, beta subunit [[Clostridium] methylpentosum DSM 5476]MDY3989020.1 indolepyruvate oxidoreductase subunit beta [Massilioclostridium sp.]MEE1491197.1 indolepyruvate oxidoreductase subunit beta [Massilioclostridium sp.]